MNSGAVLDASALLAYLFDEPGAEVVERAINGGASISLVNWAEVLTKYSEQGGDPQDVPADLRSRRILGRRLRLVPMLRQNAMSIAQLRPLARAWGLSLGDRACLALGLRLQLPVLTAERNWPQLDLGVRVHVIR